MKPKFQYAATVNRIIDADTLEVTVDVGFRMSTTLPLRVARINAPERFTPEGRLATARVAEVLGDLPAAVTVATMKPVDKYGRYLADVFIEQPRDDGGLYETTDLGRLLVEEGLAEPFMDPGGR